MIGEFNSNEPVLHFRTLFRAGATVPLMHIVCKKADAFHIQIGRELIAGIRQFPSVQPVLYKFLALLECILTPIANLYFYFRLIHK